MDRRGRIHRWPNFPPGQQGRPAMWHDDGSEHFRDGQKICRGDRTERNCSTRIEKNVREVGAHQTTERYMGVRQDLTGAPCDRLDLKLGSFGD
jgi:hypothetical protein